MIAIDQAPPLKGMIFMCYFFFFAEGQLPKGASYIEQEQVQYRRPRNDKVPSISPGEIGGFMSYGGKGVLECAGEGEVGGGA